MKKYFATFIIAAAIISTSLVSCDKDVPSINTAGVPHSTAVSATDMAPQKGIVIWPDTSTVKKGY